LTLLLAAGSALYPGAPAEKPPAPQKPAPATVACTLITTEAPRGGRLELEGKNFGHSPVVRIGGRVITRILERTETKIAVQIPADSDGGAVTVNAGSQQATCGSLTIIGKN
jgi:hypothetical protein